MGGPLEDIEDEEFGQAIDTILHCLYTFQGQLNQIDFKANPGANGNETIIMDVKSEQFWPQIHNICKNLSKESTKIAMAFSTAPQPKGHEGASVLAQLELAIVAAFSQYFSALPHINTEFGLVLWKFYHDSSLAITKSLQNFIVALRSGPDQVKKLFQSTGTVWELCDNALALPQTNRAAGLVRTQEQLRLINDALNELEEEPTEAAGEETELMNDATRTLKKGVIGLVRSARAITKKIHNSLNSQEFKTSPDNLREIDETIELIDGVSPMVDDVAGAFYEILEDDTLDWNGELKTEGEKLVNRLDDILKQYADSPSIAHASDDKGKIEFLHKALTHNQTRFTNALNREEL